MDNFREWLSDNLRYFMLGGGILIVVLVLFFSIRACVGGKEEPSKKDSDTIQQDAGDASGEDSAAPENANPMETGNEAITKLITDYYAALGNKDIGTLRTLVNNLTPADESRIANSNDYIEKYTVNSVSYKKGLTEGTYVAYTDYSYTCTGIETPVPALSYIYVVTEGEDTLKIDSAADQDTEIATYLDQLKQSDKDVQELYAKVKANYDKALESDTALYNFLNGLGEDASSSTHSANGTMLTVNGDAVNVRASASSDGDVVGSLSQGDTVEKKGQEGEWIQIEYEGETAYVHNSLVE